ncbi:hypothetical protein C8K38_111220 [Rhodococcus sp. OK611]|uniref:hypothetical protein n=1 Tax=unclassified Rhodococcus (in: high G+C Gram-positive bacteria) TaxID=192944 RepID=UPI000BDBA496|nr:MULTISPECIES: hypothetical protein [unclassified Rhodococcus (in: high G+C Gram-positive bacteria)]PTR42051.1 hypothetical protein C8K38_111220 [Rhodococcus sp. OK611]SNX91502.1 hypothetical protein SAMN05447004_11037 [Rhodococcus sp. OK270]
MSEIDTAALRVAHGGPEWTEMRSRTVHALCDEIDRLRADQQRLRAGLGRKADEVAELRARAESAEAEATRWRESNDAWALKAKALEPQVERLNEKVQAWCPHMSWSGYATGEEWCDECGILREAAAEAGER